jgi:hypothetical protein
MAKARPFPWYNCDWFVWTKSMGPLYPWSKDAWTCVWYSPWYEYWWLDYADMQFPQDSEKNCILLCKLLCSMPLIARDCMVSWPSHIHPAIISHFPQPRWNIYRGQTHEYVPPVLIWQKPLDGDPPMPILDWQYEIHGLNPNWALPDPPPAH